MGTLAWFEAHDTLGRHPKTLRLARLLGRDRRYAVGLLHDLFAWALYSADKSGALPGLDETDIAAALDFPRSRTDAVQALRQSGFLEYDGGVWRIHDWYDYAGKLLERREADRERMRKNRAQTP